MATAAELNDVATSEYIKFDTLEKGKKYKVLELDTFKSTNFGKERLCLKVLIEDGYLIMPQRYDKKVPLLKELDTENLYIIFKGRGKGEKGILDVEFFEGKVGKAAKPKIPPRKKKNMVVEDTSEEDTSEEDINEEDGEEDEEEEPEEQRPKRAPSKKSPSKAPPKKAAPKKKRA